MTFFKTTLLASAMFALTACGGAESSAKADPAKPAMSDADLFRDAPSGTYDIDGGHAYIVFSYVHQGYSKPHIRITKFDSQLNWNNGDPTKSSVTVDIDPLNIDTGVPKFDEHIRGETFFDVANHKDIRFESTALTRTTSNTGTMTGDLTMKGMTKPVTFDVTFNKGGYNQRGGSYKLGFSATADIKRSDWNLGAYAPSVGDDVAMTIEVEYDMKSEKK